MKQFQGIKVLFVAGFGPVVREPAKSRKLYRKIMGIKLKEETGGYLHTEVLEGANTFALWPLAQAAQSCFGKPVWPDDITAPQAWLEFDVADVEQATAELELRGYRVLVKNQEEPWGQTVSRFLSPEGLLLGVTIPHSMREKNRRKLKKIRR
jgi:catechol 2,3-dioxygenase-like lactoylglutathione lyase family enzyme